MDCLLQPEINSFLIWSLFWHYLFRNFVSGDARGDLLLLNARSTLGPDIFISTLPHYRLNADQISEHSDSDISTNSTLLRFGVLGVSARHETHPPTAKSATLRSQPLPLASQLLGQPGNVSQWANSNWTTNWTNLGTWPKTQFRAPFFRRFFYFLNNSVTPGPRTLKPRPLESPNCLEYGALVFSPWNLPNKEIIGYWFMGDRS